MTTTTASHRAAPQVRCRRRPCMATGSRCASSRARRLAAQSIVKEFEPGSDEPPPIDPMSRRNFFHLMGASMGLAGLAAGAGCRRYEKEEIVPLARRPEDQVPGQTLQYATTYELGGCGARARRDVVRGSPDSPRRQSRASVRGRRDRAGHEEAMRGALGVRAGRASCTSTIPIARSRRSTRARARRSRRSRPRSARSRRRSPAGARAQRSDIVADGARAEAEARSGRRRVARVRAAVVGQRAHSARRPRSVARYGRSRSSTKPRRSSLSIATSSSSTRRRCVQPRLRAQPPQGRLARRRQDEPAVGRRERVLEHRRARGSPPAMRAELGLPFAMALDARARQRYAAEQRVPQGERRSRSSSRCSPKSSRRTPAARSSSPVAASRRRSTRWSRRSTRRSARPARRSTTSTIPNRSARLTSQAITELAADMAAGRVQTLIILGGNPVYDAPADLDFAGALAKVDQLDPPRRVPGRDLAEGDVARAQGALPRGVGRCAHVGRHLTLAQPLIEPLYGGLSSIELISLLLGDEDRASRSSRRRVESSAAARLAKCVHDGFVAELGFTTAQVSVTSAAGVQLTPSQQRQQPQERRARGRLSLLDFTLRRPLREQPVAVGDARLPHEGHLGQLRARLARDRARLGIENDELITRQRRRRDRSSCPATRCRARRGTRSARARRWPYALGPRARSAAGARASYSPGFNTYKVRAHDGFDFATGGSVSPAAAARTRSRTSRITGTTSPATTS